MLGVTLGRVIIDDEVKRSWKNKSEMNFILVLKFFMITDYSCELEIVLNYEVVGKDKFIIGVC